MKILITGVTGFVGSHVAEHCLARGDSEVIGVCRWRSRRDAMAGLSGLQVVEAELTDPSSVTACLKSTRPDWIFHFAGQSSVTASLHAPAYTLTSNVISQVYLFEAMRTLDLEGVRFLVPGSCEEYGWGEAGQIPITEDSELRPLSPYGVSKVAQDLLGWQYFHSYGLQVVRTRAFHQAGPRRQASFVPSQFAKQIAEIEAGKREPVLSVGNLEAVRDYTDIRDMSRAYWLALEAGEPGDVYNVGSGTGIRIRAMLDMLLELTDVAVEVREDPLRARPSDAPSLVADATKFRTKTGWAPTIDMATMLQDTLDHWRERVKAPE